MIRIESVSQYRQALAEARQAGFRLTNCYWLPQAPEEKIRSGKLFLEAIPNGLLILEEEGSFLRCFYYLSAQEPPQPLGLEKELVLEYPYREPLEEKDRLHLRRIGELGFRRSRQSRQLTAVPEALVVCPTHAEAGEAVEAEAGEILSLLLRTFDPRYAYLPTMEGLLASIAAGEVWVIRREGRPVAVLRGAREKQYACLRQLAVAPEFRGRGYAAALLNRYHRHYLPQVVGFRHWVDLENSAAIALYQRFGYRFGLRRADEYIKEETL